MVGLPGSCWHGLVALACQLRFLWCVMAAWSCRSGLHVHNGGGAYGAQYWLQCPHALCCILWCVMWPLPAGEAAFYEAELGEPVKFGRKYIIPKVN